MAAAGLLAVPGILIASHFFHIFDSWRAYYEFRSMPGSELTAAGLGLAAGIIVWYGPQKRMPRLMVATVVLTIISMVVVLPYIKPLLAPVRYQGFRDSWDDMVCRQSTGSSCGPACTATLLRHFGIDANELQIARECFTYSGGTENWYLARALRNRGLKVTFLTKTLVAEIPVPSIAGVKIGGAGHFITILDDLGDPYLVGDPLIGQSVCPKQLMAKRFQFTGFIMKVER